MGEGKVTKGQHSLQKAPKGSQDRPPKATKIDPERHPRRGIAKIGKLSPTWASKGIQKAAKCSQDRPPKPTKVDPERHPRRGIEKVGKPSPT